MLRVLIISVVTATLLPLRAASAQEKAASQDKSSPVLDDSSRSSGTEDYVIQPQDLIRVQIYQEPDLSRELRVSQEGRIELPLIRAIDVKNKTVREAEELIRKLYDADYLVNPQVNVSVLEYAPRRVEVFGMVATPGLVDFPKEEGMTLTGAISRAGSFTRLANKKGVTIRRTMPGGEIRTIGPINVEDLTKGDAKNAWPLQPGDVITVPERIL